MARRYAFVNYDCPCPECGAVMHGTAVGRFDGEVRDDRGRLVNLFYFHPGVVCPACGAVLKHYKHFVKKHAKQTA